MYVSVCENNDVLHNTTTNACVCLQMNGHTGGCVG